MIYFLCAIAAILLTFVGSYWIDKLYEMPTAPLSFPEDISRRSRFRKPILAVALFLTNLQFATVPSPKCFYLIVAAFFLLLITMTDFEQYVIFDRMILPFTLIGFMAVFHLQMSFNHHLGAALVGGGTFLLLAILTRGALGGGDIKLIAALGIWFGPHNLSNVIAAGSILGGVAALIMLLVNKKDRKSYFAYGPYFTLTAIYILLSSLSLG